ncbi:MAG: DUF3822 family protein [Bacteroidales bacterium]|nr:DUF3822 family protein [Bacteroidales bacterium]
MEGVSFLTPKCTLVPSHFFEPASSREILGEVVVLDESDSVKYLPVPQYDAVLVYAVPGDGVTAPPELWRVLDRLPACQDYNKILASHREGFLYLAIAQGKSLLLANVFPAGAFATAEYYIFLAMKSLQLNPEVSTICFMSELAPDDEMSLYRYFKSVETV